jgi:hypothetical protein
MFTMRRPTRSDLERISARLYANRWTDVDLSDYAFGGLHAVRTNEIRKRPARCPTVFNKKGKKSKQPFGGISKRMG